MTAYFPPLKLAQYGAYEIPVPVQFKTRTGQPLPFRAAPQPYPGRFIGKERFGTISSPVAWPTYMKPVTPYMTTGQSVRKVYGLQGYGTNGEGFTEPAVPISQIMNAGLSDTTKLEEIARKWSEEDSGWMDSLGKKALGILLNLYIAEINAYTTYAHAKTIMTKTDRFMGMSLDQIMVELIGQDGRDNMEFVINKTGEMRRELNKWRNQLSLLPAEWKRVLFMFMDFDRRKITDVDNYPGFGSPLGVLIVVAIIILAVGAVTVAILLNLPETKAQANARMSEAQAARAKSEADEIVARNSVLEYALLVGDEELRQAITNDIKKSTARKEEETKAAQAVGRDAGIWPYIGPAISTIGKGAAILGIAYLGTMYLTSGSFRRMWTRIKGQWAWVSRKPKAISVEQEHRAVMADIAKRKGVVIKKKEVAVGEAGIRQLEREVKGIEKPSARRKEKPTFGALR